MSRITTQKLSVVLAGRPVLRDIDVEVSSGEIVAVVGANGAGKSTLLRAMAGLVRIDAGHVVLDGIDIARTDRRALGRRIAYLPQDRTVHWPLSVRRVVALGRLPHDAPTRDASAVDEALAAMDIEGLAERPVTELSGGELARVLQARALAQEAEFLIADEPTSGLDMAHVLELFAHFRRLAATGRGIIVALHDISLALRFCSRTILLKDGRVLAAGSSREVVTPGSLAEAFGVAVKVADIDDLPIVITIETLT